ncbi:hypothetical protein SAMN05421504_101887 [Amycolatopsis xylanica]|uniref:STAS domain-containing protein n=1 Tax=Amycolatopsis xylanica TaxID=589385 RepID=A0A1H2UIR2_9PSEU|nr:hypothetical protein [Amycolatopsis xylanica]SDW55449.1 hypothetical protein SAMN05421504_101887 [Amycolatopsis xylanica]
MQVYLTHEADVTLVRPIGTLDVHSFPELRDTLLKCAVEQPTAVIVLMDGLQVDQNQLYSVFVQAWMRAADWPGVPILLVARDRALYHRVSALPAARFVPVHTSVRKAVKAAGVPPRRRRAETTLPPMNGSSPLARQFVAKTCGEWDVRWMTYDAASVATELVENTLQHTDSEPVLRLELRKHLLTVAVSDESPRPAVLTERRADGRLSLGLLVVAQCARVWGCTPTLSGGKVTWAVLPTDARRYELPGEL